MSGDEPIVHVVDDDVSVRTALTRLLRAAGYSVRAWASASEFLQAGAVEGQGCILLDLRMPEMDGLELQQALVLQQAQAHHPGLPIIFLTGHGDIATGVRAMKAGAVDFLTKPVERETLLAAVAHALARDDANHAVHEELLTLQQRYATLTPREREVFERVVAGMPNKLIGMEIGAAERTVKLHRARVMEKMQAGSLADLVRIADRLNATSSPH
jgi:FixJ family two-component response regulator